MDGYTGIQRVFLGWGQVWLDKTREEALRSRVSSNPHSPAKFRINGVVRNIPEFYEAFNVKATDSLYLAPKKELKFGNQIQINNQTQQQCWVFLALISDKEI